MRITLTTRHCELDPEDRLLIEQRLEKLSRFARDIMEAHVIVSAEKSRYTAEIALKVRGPDIVSREVAHGTRVALERAADRLEHQIRKLKERRLERRRGDRSRASEQLGPPSGSPDAVAEEFGETASEE